MEGTFLVLARGGILQDGVQILLSSDLLQVYVSKGGVSRKSALATNQISLQQASCTPVVAAFYAQAIHASVNVRVLHAAHNGEGACFAKARAHVGFDAVGEDTCRSGGQRL